MLWIVSNWAICEMGGLALIITALELNFLQDPCISPFYICRRLVPTFDGLISILYFHSEHSLESFSESGMWSSLLASLKYLSMALSDKCFCLEIAFSSATQRFPLRLQGPASSTFLQSTRNKNNLKKLKPTAPCVNVLLMNDAEHDTTGCVLSQQQTEPWTCYTTTTPIGLDAGWSAKSERATSFQSEWSVVNLLTTKVNGIAYVYFTLRHKLSGCRWFLTWCVTIWERNAHQSKIQWQILLIWSGAFAFSPY